MYRLFLLGSLMAFCLSSNVFAQGDLVFANSDFESGDFTNWIETGTCFAGAPAFQMDSGFQGSYSANSRVAGEPPVGELRSTTFTLNRRFLSFLIGGWPGVPPATDDWNYVGLYRASDDAEIGTMRPPGQDAMVRRFIDGLAVQGEVVYVKVVDDAAGGGFAWLSADDFRQYDFPDDPFLNADFEIGNFENWVTSGTAWGAGPYTGGFGGQVDTYHVNSLNAGGEAAVGELISTTFTLDRRHLTFRIGGYSGVPPTTDSYNYIGLYRAGDDSEIGRRYMPNTNDLHPAFIDGEAALGEVVYIKAVDDAAGGGFAWMSADHFRLTDSDEPFLNADFELGTLDGWSVTGTAFGTEAALRYDAGYEGDYCANSRVTGEPPTGELRSPDFTLSGRFLSFRIGGWSGWPPAVDVQNYVALYRASDDLEIGRVWAPQGNDLVPRLIDGAGYEGEQVYVKIVDDAADAGFAWLSADSFAIAELTPGLIVVDDDPGNDFDTFATNGQANITGGNAVVLARNLVANNLVPYGVNTVVRIESNGTFTGDLNWSIPASIEVAAGFQPTLLGDATLAGGGLGVLHMQQGVWTEPTTLTIRGASPASPLIIDSGPDGLGGSINEISYTTGTRVIWENVRFITDDAEFCTIDFNTADDRVEQIFRNCEFAGDWGPNAAARGTRFENCDFASPGFRALFQGHDLVLSTCTLGNGAWVHMSFMPADATLTVIDCTLSSSGGTFGQDYLPTAHPVTINVINPTFEPTGAVTFACGTTAAVVNVSGTPENKVDLNPAVELASSLWQANAGTLTLTDCMGDVPSVSGRLAVTDLAGSLAGDVYVSYDRCQFLNGAGTCHLYTANPSTYSARIDAINSILGDSTFTNILGVNGLHEGPNSVNLYHSTLFGSTPDADPLINTNPGDTVMAAYCILQSTLAGSGSVVDSAPITGVGNIIDGNGSGLGNPADTVFFNPSLTSDGHLNQGSPAIDAAVGSTLDIDIDGQPRPLDSAPEIGADELLRINAAQDWHLLR